MEEAWEAPRVRPDIDLDSCSVWEVFLTSLGPSVLMCKI